MLNVKNEGIVLEASNRPFEQKGVLNPACVEENGLVHMFYRAVSNDNISTIGYCIIRGDEIIKRYDNPILKPGFDYECMGIEDPRITFINDTYYLFYTAYDGKNALVAYATAEKLPNFTKKGLISPRITYERTLEKLKDENLSLKYRYFESIYQDARGKNILLWEKDITLFPEKINNKFCLIHRILPGMQLIYFDKFSELTTNFWERYLTHLDENILLDGKAWYESRNIGGGCPPIRTKVGWLIIYHSVEDTSDRGHVYHAGAALLDLANPQNVIGRLQDPLFSPTFSYEKTGVVNNVVFPTAAILRDDRLYIYHGAGDKVIALKSVKLEALLEALQKSTPASRSLS